MHIIEVVPGQSYANAVELPNKRGRWVNGAQKSSPSGNSGTSKANRVAASARGVYAEMQKADRLITAETKRRLIICNGKRTWMLESEYQARTSTGTIQLTPR